MSIYQLINEIDGKEIVLPAIQRDFVWDRDRIRLLFDSMMRGYPVGIVLLWETYQPIQFRYFTADFRRDTLHSFHDHAVNKRTKLVLDGQQRLSSIYVALRGQYEGEDLYFDIMSGRDKDDYSEEKFVFEFLSTKSATEFNKLAINTPDDSEEEVRFFLKVKDVIGKTATELLSIRENVAKELNLSVEDKLRVETNLLTLLQTLTGDEEILKTQTIDSKLPAADAKRKTAFDILEIFVRINTQGVRLSRSDLIVSMLRLYWKDASDVLPAFLKEVNAGSGLDIDTDFVIRCMFSTAGLGTRLDFELLRKQSSVEKIRASYKKCFEAIRSTVDFVREDCKLNSSRLIGGISTLVPFVQYLFESPKQAFPKDSLSQAVKSLYLFAFSKVFTQHSESRTGAFVRDFLPSAQEIYEGSPFPYSQALRFVNLRSNFSPGEDRLFANNVELALTLVQGRSGAKVKFEGNLPELDHIFPQATLFSKKVPPHEINDIGNFWILPRTLNRNKSAKHPKEYLADVEQGYLAVACIDLRMLDIRAYRTFVSTRRLCLTKKLLRLTGINPADSALLEEDLE